VNVVQSPESEIGALAARPLLSVRDLAVTFGRGADQVDAVAGVSFDVPSGSVVGVVGESGSGKSVTSLALTRLFSKSANVTLRGEVSFQGKDLTTIASA